MRNPIVQNDESAKLVGVKLKMNRTEEIENIENCDAGCTASYLSTLVDLNDNVYRSSPTDRQTRDVVTRSTFPSPPPPSPPRSFARQLIYRRALELYAAARRGWLSPTTSCPLLSTRRGFRHRPRQLFSLLIAKYRIAYLSICVTTRSTACLMSDPSSCRFIAVVTTSSRNACRLQKSIAIRSEIRRLARVTSLDFHWIA